MDSVPRVVVDALRFQNPRREGLLAIKNSQWRAILSSWRVVRLTLPLRQVCGEHLPEWVRERVDVQIQDNGLRFERMKLVYSEAAAALKAAGAEHAVMKGFSLWPDYVEHPRYRAQSDIDLYCPLESIERAQAALISLGYRHSYTADHIAKDHLPAMVPQSNWQWRGNLFDPEIPISFELHFQLWDTSVSRIRPAGLERFWERRLQRSVDGLSFWSLDEADGLAFVALNLLRDLLRGYLAPEQVYCLARFLHVRADDHTFWQKWKLQHDDSLRRLEVIAFEAAEKYFECSLSDEVREEQAQLPEAIHAWFRYFSESLLAGPQSSRRKDGIWLHLNLLTSARDKSVVLLQRFVPVPTRVPTVASVVPAENEATATSRSAVGRALKSCRRSLQYAAWYVARPYAHLRSVPLTLARGVGYWFATRRLSRQFWTFLAASLCFDLGMTMFFFLYNLFLLDQGYKEDFLGLLMGVMNVGSLACTIPAGLLVHRLGPRRSMTLCLVLVSSVSVARTLFAVQSALLALAFLAGFVTTIWAVAIAPAIARLTEERSRPYGFSVVLSSGIGVGVLANLAASRLPAWCMRVHPALSSTQGKQVVLLLACGIVSLGLIPLSRVQFARMDDAKSTERKIYPRGPFIWRFLVGVGLWSLVTGSLSPLSNVYFSQYLRTPLEQIGVIFSFSNLLQTFGVLAAPFLFRKFGLIGGISFSQILAAALLGMLALMTGALPAAVVYVVFTGFLWMAQPGLFSLLMDSVAPSEQAGASSLNFFVISLVQAFAVTITGAAFSRFGYPAVLAALTTVAFVTAFSFWGLLGRRSSLIRRQAGALMN